RAHDLARGVDHAGPFGRRQRDSGVADHAVDDEDVLRRIERARRIEHPAAADQHRAATPREDRRRHRRHAGDPPRLPARRNSTAMRTATPFVTWSRITEYGPSATSGDSSMPRLTGPGCMINTSGRAWTASFSSVRPQ